MPAEDLERRGHAAGVAVAHRIRLLAHHRGERGDQVPCLPGSVWSPSSCVIPCGMDDVVARLAADPEISAFVAEAMAVTGGDRIGDGPGAAATTAQ